MQQCSFKTKQGGEILQLQQYVYCTVRAYSDVKGTYPTSILDLGVRAAVQQSDVILAPRAGPGRQALPVSLVTAIKETTTFKLNDDNKTEFRIMLFFYLQNLT
jgi:hypothetical protein